MPTDLQKSRLRLLVADLRTPGLKQLTKLLSKPGIGDCCLFRACVVAKAEGLPLIFENEIDRDNGGECVRVSNTNRQQSSRLNLIPAVMDFFGFSSTGGFLTPVKYDDEQMQNSKMSLDTLNDSGLTFPQIADLIEWEYAL